MYYTHVKIYILAFLFLPLSLSFLPDISLFPLSSFFSPSLSAFGFASDSYALLCWEHLGRMVTVRLLNCHLKCSGLGWRILAKCKSFFISPPAIKNRRGFTSAMTSFSIVFRLTYAAWSTLLPLLMALKKSGTFFGRCAAIRLVKMNY